MKDEITEAEYFAELDKLRETKSESLTDEQYKFLEYGRENIVPIIWKVLTEAFNKAWDTDFKQACLYIRYEKERERRDKDTRSK